MADNRSTRGITLVELMVVIVLIAIISSIVGPRIANRLENVSLQTTATQLAAQFRRAQADARITQTPVAAVYSDHTFHFLRSTTEIGTLALPVSVTAVFEDGGDTVLMLPSGQIAGPERFQLLNRNGRKAAIELDFLNGVRAIQSAR